MRCCKPNRNFFNPFEIPPNFQPTDRIFVMTFLDINAAGVANINDVAEWNAFMFLNFDSVSISGNTATFKGTQQQQLVTNWTTGLIPGGDFNTTGVYDYGKYVDSIDIQSFDSCFVLEGVLLPIITNIPQYAFSQTSALTSFYADAVVTIGDYAFSNSGSCDYSFSNCTTLGIHSFGFSQTTSIGIPSVTAIPETCFQNCTALTSVIAPLATTVGNSGFEGCASLTSIDLPSCLELHYRAFRNCSNLSSVDLPVCENFIISGVYPTGTFEACNDLTLLNIPNILGIADPTEDGVFAFVFLNSNLTINVNSIQQTIDAGNPDGDLVAIDAANPGQVTINYV